MWYVLAAANALSGDADLIAGTQLKVPEMAASKNDATSFRPYNPGEIVGSTSPQLLPAPPKSGCSTIATIIRVVIAVVIAVYAPQASYAILMSAGGEAVAQTVEINQGYREGYNVGAIVVAGISAGVSPGGTTTWGKIGMAAVRAAGNYATSYLVNRALGIQDSFSWRGVASAAVSSAIAQAAFGNTPTETAAAQSRAGSMIPFSAPFSWSRVAQGVVVAAKEAGKSVIRSGIGYAVDKAIIGEAHWNWGQVMSSAAVQAGSAFGGAYRQSGIEYNVQRMSVQAANDAVMPSKEEIENVINSSPKLASNDSKVSILDKLSKSILDAGGIYSDYTPFDISPEQLNGFADSNIINSPEKLSALTLKLKEYVNNQISGLSDKETALATSLIYGNIFQNDQTAVWFGAAPYATQKVAATYDLLSLQDFTGNDDAGIIRKGFFEGNKAIFRSMLAAEIVYQIGGTKAVAAVENLGNGAFGGSNNNKQLRDSLVQSFELRDNAKRAFKSGNTNLGNQLLHQSLQKSAVFEQRVVIQPFYDKNYTFEGTTKTMRSALNNFNKMPMQPLSITPMLYNFARKSLFNSMAAVNIGGTKVAFDGNDVGNPDQRMKFVNNVAKQFMTLHQSINSDFSGPELIHQDHMYNIVRTFDQNSYEKLRIRYGF